MSLRLSCRDVRRTEKSGLTLTSSQRRATVGDRRFAVGWHLAWALAVAVAAAVLAWRGSLVGGPEPLALAAVGGAALFGALLAAFEGEGAAAFSIVLWALGGASACLLTYGPAGPLAAWCLAPLAAGAAYGRPRLLALGAAAGVAAAGLTALASTFMLLPKPPEELSIWLSLLALGTTGLGLAAALVALQGKMRGDDARAREAELKLREALDHQPQLLMALYPGGRILEAFGEAPPGIETPDLPDRHLGELISDEDRPAVEAALTEAASAGSAEIAFVPAHDPQGWCVLIVRRMRSVIAAVRCRRVFRTTVIGAQQGQRTVDHESEKRQQRNRPQPLCGCSAQRMHPSRGRGLQERKHQPFNRLMFWRFTVCR